MIHLNRHLRESPLFYLDWIFWENYSAQSIDDFLRHKEEIQPTRKLLPLGVFWYGLAVIEFPSVTYEPLDQNKGLLVDLTSSLEVGLRYQGYTQGLSDEGREGLRDGMRLYNPWIYYKPKDQLVWLAHYETEGPAAVERKPDLVSIRGMVGAPVPV